jgi:cell division protein FtsQ
MVKGKRILKVFSWLTALALPVLLLSFSEANNTVQAREIDIVLEGDLPFQKPKDILETVDILKDSASLINIRLLEESLMTLNGVEEAEVFSDLGERLHVRIEQAAPLFRLFDTDSSYYVSQEGEVMALSPYQSVQLPLVSGGGASKRLEELHALFLAIQADEILNKSIDAAKVSETGECTLYSGHGGAHEVMLGGLNHWPDKLQRLSVFYREMVTTGKRTNFGKLDLRFNGQVVLSK